jgi:serralysin
MPTPSGSGATSTVPLAGNYVIDSLVAGYKWGAGVGTGASITYSFPDFSAGATWSTYYDPANGGSGEPSNAFSLSAQQQTQFAAALQGWANVANLTFTQTTDTASNVGDIRVAYSYVLPSGAYAWAYYPTGWPGSGDVWLNANYPSLTGSTFAPGSYEYMTFTHELGHALGLSHSFGHGATSLLTADDTHLNTVMSYTSIAGQSSSGLYFYPTGPMSYDIAAIQYIYGPNMNYNAGDTNYVFNETGQYMQTLWDAGGNDTITYNSVSNGGYIDLTPGAWSNLGIDDTGYYNNGSWQYVNIGNTVQIYNTVTIENAVGGAGPDTLVGNAVANQLVGNDGNDSITGGAGNDTEVGGNGNDTLYGNTGDDSLLGGAGDDFIYGGQQDDYIDAGDGNDYVEGNLGNDTILGGLGNDWLHGGQGNDVVYGNQGNDTLFGGQGDDSVFGGQNDDSIDAGAGNDYVEGNLGNDTIFGNTGDDFLHGGQGDDLLDGGPGNDTLTGGVGNDTYQYDAQSFNTSDVTAGSVDTIVYRPGDADVISMLGLNDDIAIGGVALSALSVDTVIGASLTANTSIAFSGGLLELDLDHSGSYAAGSDFTIALQNVTSVTYNHMDHTLHLA